MGGGKHLSLIGKSLRLEFLHHIGSQLGVRHKRNIGIGELLHTLFNGLHHRGIDHGIVATIKSAICAICHRVLHAQHAVGIKVVHSLIEKHA